MSVKKIAMMSLVGGNLLAAGANAKSFQLGLSFRGESQGTTTETKVGTAEAIKTHDSRFKFRRLRLFAKGNPTESAFWGIRLRMNKLSQTNEGTGVSPAVDYAFVGYKFSPDFTVSAGKLYTGHGAVYGNQMFHHFYYSNALPKTYLAAYLLNGFSFEYKAGHNKIKLLVGNNQKTDGNMVDNANSPAYGLVYKGDFGIVKPIASFFQIPTDKYTMTNEITVGGVTTTSTTKYLNSTDTALSLGALIETAGARIGLSHLGYTQAEREMITAGVKSKDKATAHSSSFLQVDYKLGEFKPVFMYEMTDMKKDGDADNDLSYNTVSLVVEHEPKDSAGLFFYAGLNLKSSSQGKDTNKQEVTTTKVFLGLKMDSAGTFM